MPLSSEQKAVFDAIGNGDSVAVDAGAGSGKTHTANACCFNYAGPCELIPFARSLMDSQSKLFAAYSHINVVNFHTRGKRTLGNVTVESGDRKLVTIAENLYGSMGRKVAGLAKCLKIEAYGLLSFALSANDIADKYGYFLTEKEMDSAEDTLENMAINVLELSDKDATTIDFEDMLRMPIILGRKCQVSKDALIVLDEVQDFTPLAYAFVINCVIPKGAQVLMIGDPSRQSLMQFAGASAGLFDIMADAFNCKRLELTVNRRCAKSIVANAPHKGNMVALDDAPEGTVETLSESEVIAEIMQGGHDEDALLCEKNAPILSLGIKLITEGVPVRMRTAKLDSLLFRYAFKYIVDRTLKVGDIAPKLWDEISERAGDGKDVAEFRDVAKCVEALETYCLANGILKTGWKNRRPVHPIQQALEKITSGTKGITLMTGHTSKGLEWNTVFYLPSPMKAAEKEWQQHQNDCLSHVIHTRAKTRFVTLAVIDSAE